MQRNPLCPKCNNSFIAKDTGRQNRQPLLLRCGHTYCEGCLKTLARETKSKIICPDCKHETQLDGTDGSVKRLWPDMYLSGLIMCNQKALLEQELNKIVPAGMIMPSMKRRELSTDKDKICRECCSRLASCKCVKCDCIMCSNCFEKVHSMSNTLKQHEATPLIEEPPDTIMSPVCLSHDGRLIEYFCEEDNTPICSRCVIIGEHKGHSITSMEDKNKSVFSDMQPALHTASQVIKKLKKAEKILGKSFPDMKTETTCVIDEIRQHFQMLHGSLQARERDLIEEVYEAYKTGIEPLHDMKNMIQDEMKRVDMSIKAAHRVLNNNEEVILNAKDILDQLTRTKEIPCIVVPRTPSETERIIFSPVDNLNSNISSHGAISGTVAQRISVHTLAEMPEELVNDDSDTLSVENGGGDNVSIVSNTETGTSEDVIIEDEQEIVLMEEKEKEVSIGNSKSKGDNNKPTITPKSMAKGHSELVLLTHIKNPCQFMVQRKIDTKKLRSLSRGINNWCISPQAEKHKPNKVEKGDLLLVKYTCDNSWYRARVKNVLGSNIHSPSFKIEVQYMDYGNSEITTIDRVRKMQSKFLKSGDFLIECGLHDIAPTNKDWSADAIQSFVKMTENKPMMMTVIREVNNVLQVDLSKPANEDIIDDRPVSVRDSLVFLELANFISPECANIPGGLKKVKGRSYMKREPCCLGDKMNVVVTTATDPFDFYVRESGDEVEYFKSMMTEIQETYSNESGDLWTVYCPYKGMICVSQFSADGLWYRAEVTKLPGNRQVDLQYVDFGNQERVPYFRLRKIIDTFVMLPIQAVHCKLADVEPVNKKFWSREAKRWMSETVTMKHMKMQVTGTTTDGTACVVLHNLITQEPYSINGQLVGAGLANSTGRLSADVPEDSFKQAVNDTSSDPLRNIKGSSPRKSETPPRTQSPVKAVSTVNTVSPAVEVSPIKNKSPQSQKARDTGLKLDVQKAAQASQKSPKDDNDSASSPSIIEIKISHFISPSDFWVQLASSGSKGLDKLMDELYAEYENTEHQWVSWSVGSFCAAKYTEDNRWYRAKVSKLVNKNQIEVFMVDFGYISTVEASALRPLQKPYLKPMCYSFHCHLANLVPAGDGHNWSRTACEFMIEETHNKNMFIVKKGDTEENSLPVDLLVEEEIAETALEPAKKDFHSLIDKLVDNGLSIPIRRKPPVKLATMEDVDNDVEIIAYPPMHFKPMVFPAENRLTVIPIYIDYECVIYVQEVTEDDTFIVMTDQLQEKFGMSVITTDLDWTVGQACVSFFAADQMWYRAEIMEVEPERIKVKYYDYGNSEWVTTDKLRADIAEFLDIPRQCLLCVLPDLNPVSEDGKWPVVVLDHIHKLLVNNTCTIDILHRQEKHLDVKLILPDGQDLSLYISKLGHGENSNSLLLVEDFSQKIYNKYTNSNPFKKIKFETVGECFPVQITHVEVPNVIYFQHTKQIDDMDERVYKINNQLIQLENLAAKLNDIGPTAPVLPQPRKGLACCAQFSFDSCWYRALIVDIDAQTAQILVLYVDYGTSELVTIDRIRSLAPKYLNLPAQAVRARLDGVYPKPGTPWSKNSLKSMIDAVGNKQLLLTVKSFYPLTVDLSERTESGAPGQLAYQTLMEEGKIVIQQKTTCEGLLDLEEKRVLEEKKLLSFDGGKGGISSWAEQVEESEIRSADNDDVIIEEIIYEENFEEGIDAVKRINAELAHMKKENSELDLTLEAADFADIDVSDVD